MKFSRTRVIPCLLLRGDGLVKTVKFKEYNYIGDPINTVRIFNELEVDELVFLDITASVEKRGPNLKLLENIAIECFMPLGYGGGIKTFEDAKNIFSIGFEKIILNTSSFYNKDLITQIADVYGTQAVVASVDYKKNLFGKNVVYSVSGSTKESVNLTEWVVELEKRGAGEIILTSIDKDGTWEGYDLKTIKEVSSLITIPLIANGGAGTLEHLGQAVKLGGASALGVGSMVVYQKKEMGVLVNFPDKKKLKEVFTNE